MARADALRGTRADALRSHDSTDRRYDFKQTRRHTAMHSMQSMQSDQLAHLGSLHSPMADHPLPSGVLLLKTPASSGPISVLNAVAFERDPGVRRHLLSVAAANTPSKPSWWVQQGAALHCFRAEEEWRASAKPRLTIDLREYSVLQTHDAKQRLAIALGRQAPKRRKPSRVMGNTFSVGSARCPLPRTSAPLPPPRYLSPAASHPLSLLLYSTSPATSVPLVPSPCYLRPATSHTRYLHEYALGCS